MSAFLGAIGFVGIIVGIVLMVIGRIKKRKYRGGIIAIKYCGCAGAGTK